MRASVRRSYELLLMAARTYDYMIGTLYDNGA